MMQGRLAPTRRLRAAVAGALLVVAAGSAGAQAVPDRGALPLGAPEVEARPIMPTGEDPGTASDLGTWQTVGALAVVVGLIVALGIAARWTARRQGGLSGQFGAGGRAPSGVAEVLARYPVARGQTLVLLHVGRRVIVAFHTVSRRGGAAMTPISEVTDPEEVADLLLRTREADAESADASFREAVASAEAAYTEPAPMPTGSRRVQVSPAGDRVELLGHVRSDMNTHTTPATPGESALDAVARLRARLRAVSGGGVDAQAGARA
jgi:hypothetical protein